MQSSKAIFCPILDLVWIGMNEMNESALILSAFENQLIAGLV